MRQDLYVQYMIAFVQQNFMSALAIASWQMFVRTAESANTTPRTKSETSQGVEVK